MSAGQRMMTSAPVSEQAVLETIASVLAEGKAEDTVTIGVAAICDVADHIVISSGLNSRHVKALTTRLLETLRAEHGLRPSVEGEDAGNWVVIDLGHVIVHLQRPEVRAYYDLAGLWKDGTTAP